MTEKSVRLMSVDERKAWEDEQAAKILEEDFRKDKTFKLGLIQESGYLCVGDSFQDAGKAFDDSDRVKGLNFKVPYTKKGKVGKGVYFGGLKPTCIGDPYKTDQERIFEQKKQDRLHGNQLRLEAKARYVKSRGGNPDEVELDDLAAWRPVGPHRKVEDTFLSFVDKNTPDAKVIEILRAQKEKHAARKVKEFETAPWNVKTCPMPYAPTGVFDRRHKVPEHIPEPYREAEFLAAQAKREARKNGEDSPIAWRPANPMKTNIIDAVEHHQWMASRDTDEPTLAEILKAKRLADKEDSQTKPAWKPNDKQKSSIFDMINKFPLHIPDPDSLEGGKKKKVEEADDAPPSWKPSNGKTLTRPTRTIVLNKRNMGIRW